ACHPLQPYSWIPIEGGGRRMFSPHLKNGVVVQVGSRTEFGDRATFERAILALDLEFKLAPTPHVRFRSLNGRTLEFTYGQTPLVDGTPLAYERWPLFGGPFMDAAVDSEQLTLKWVKMRRRLDFRTLTVTDWKEGGN